MDRLQTHTYTTSKRQSGRAAEREEKGGRWFTREREPKREADLTSAAHPPHALPPPSPNPLSKQMHNPHQERERNTRRLGDGSIYSCGASFGSFHTPCVCVCIRVHVCQREGAGVGYERHGVLSNSPPHLMAQLHHYLAHTLGQNRLLGRRIDKSITLSMRRGGGHSSLPGIHCRSQRN